jgi:hypothetical protein
MQWDETVASRCRYGDVAGRLFDGADVIFESSEDDYQGFANVFAQLRDGRFCHYEWTYGSCSGCDEWEDRGLSDDEIEAEMRRAAVFFEDVATVRRYLNLADEFQGAGVPSANSPTNGAIAGALRTLCGGAAGDFVRIGEAFVEWLRTR